MTSHPAAETSPETIATRGAGIGRHPVRDAHLLVALDVDGTVLHHDGHLSSRVVAGVRVVVILMIGVCLSSGVGWCGWEEGARVCRRAPGGVLSR